MRHIKVVFQFGWVYLRRYWVRLALGVLLIDMSFAGRDVACAHEAPAAELAAAAHQGPSSHSSHPLPDPEPVPCDDSEAVCCEAVAPCTLSGIPAGGVVETGGAAHLAAAIFAVHTRPHSMPLEVATPPPRG